MKVVPNSLSRLFACFAGCGIYKGIWLLAAGGELFSTCHLPSASFANCVRFTHVIKAFLSLSLVIIEFYGLVAVAGQYCVKIEKSLR